MGNTNQAASQRWHTEILTPETSHALDYLASQAWLKRSRWYLAGGTALALHEGHRQSLDLDFFTHEGSFVAAPLIGHLPEAHWRATVIQEGTVYGELFGSKLSFISYPFFLNKEEPAWYGNVRMLNPRDIAVMKILAISQRGKKRDFVDLYWYCTKYEPLLDVFRRLPVQYPHVNHNYHHIVKSLMYFTDAEEDPMPRLFFDVAWKTIKSYFSREAPEVLKGFLSLKDGQS